MSTEGIENVRFLHGAPYSLGEQALAKVVVPSAANDLRSDASTGTGRHWWRRLRPLDFLDHQLPDQVGEFSKPKGW